MRCASWVAATTIVTGLGACSLTTSLDGLSNGEVVETPGGSDATSPDAATSDGALDTGPGTDTGTNADAEAGAAAYRAVVLADAPLAYYRLDDQGTTAKDETGAHDGVYMGSPTHAGGAIAGDANKAAVFDGSSDYVAVGDVLPFLATAPFTIEAWASPANTSGPSCIASKSYASGGVSGGITEGYTLYLDPGTSSINFLRLRNSAQDGAQGAALTNGTFSHVVATYDGATLEIWVNGVSVGSGPSARALVSHTKPLTIGASRGGIYCYFRGALDEVAFYGAALPSARIAAHFKAGTGK